MLSQVVAKTIWIAFFVSSFILLVIVSNRDLRGYNFPVLIDFAYDKIDKVTNTIAAKPKYIPPFARSYELRKVQDFLITHLIIFGVIFLISTISLAIIWQKFGKQKSEKKSGILSGPEVKRILQRERLTSDIKVDGIPLVKDSHKQHILITGSTGSGKTNLIHKIIPQIRQRGDSAIILDSTDSMAKIYQQDGDINFNLFDGKSCWDVMSDVSEVSKKNLFASSLYAADISSDSFWSSASKLLVIGVLDYVQAQKGSDHVLEFRTHLLFNFLIF